MVGHVARTYRRSAVVLAAQDDWVALRLVAAQPLPLRVVMQAHEHLAAFWRLTKGHLYPDPTFMDGGAWEAWQKWVTAEATLWIVDNPSLVRHTALLLASAGRPEALAAERALWAELRSYYPLPPPEQDDLLDVSDQRKGRVDRP
jgi:hypothetical protein